jgi:hypothetical protein
LQEKALSVHKQGLEAWSRLHDLAVRNSNEQARIYRQELTCSAGWIAFKKALDPWCACWFWPAEELQSAPLPINFHDPPPETLALTSQIATAKRFFHWELEFSDVFCKQAAGFDAILGNPPWDIAKPNSKEFFPASILCTAPTESRKLYDSRRIISTTWS